MEANELFSKLRESLIGRIVTHTCLAADSLILYVECEPGDKQGFIIWVDPPWHVSAPEGVLLGSRQTQGDTDDSWPTKEELNRISGPFHGLRDNPITSLEVDPRSRDLTIAVSERYWVRTFATDPTRDLWEMHNIAQDSVLVACAARFYTRKKT